MPPCRRRFAPGLCRGAVLALVTATLTAAASGPTARAGVTAAGVGAVAAAPLTGGALPVEVELALAQARVPREAMVAVVEEIGMAGGIASRPAAAAAVTGTSGAGAAGPVGTANGTTPPASLVAWQAQWLVNPASLMKLLTTSAALELLGPAFSWSTPVWLNGRIAQPGPRGVLEGDLVIQGNGDPKLVVERVWLLLRRVRQLGVREIRGDIVLDRSAFAVPPQGAADFDGEALRPYNVAADALLLNYKSLALAFSPDAARGVAVVSVEPPLAGVRVDATVPLASGPCGDWRAALRLDFSDPAGLRFAGRYPQSCAEQAWPLAYPDPARYNARLLTALWGELGGTLSGTVRDGVAPAGPPSFELRSPALAEVVRDINKFSNNVMAQQLFLTLGRLGNAAAGAPAGSSTPESARAVLGRWLDDRFGEAGRAAVVDNGSGLSRSGRVSARLLADVLRAAWSGPLMPELLASLPVAGLDGTLRRGGAAVGRAHLKTGSLRDVNGIAGVVLGASGRRYVLVAIVNHPNAAAARPALDALLQWTADDSARLQRAAAADPFAAAVASPLPAAERGALPTR